MKKMHSTQDFIFVSCYNDTKIQKYVLKLCNGRRQMKRNKPMEQKHKDVCLRAKKIIEREVCNGTETKEIKEAILDMLDEVDVGITDIQHFNREYFERFFRQTINGYITSTKIKYGAGNINQNKRFIVKEKCQVLEEYDDGTGKRMEEFLAESEDAARKKYCDRQYKSIPEDVLKATIFEDFWIAVGYGDVEYIVENFEKKEEILEMADKMYIQYFDGIDIEPEELYPKCNTENMANEYWDCLTENDKKWAYYIYNYHNLASWILYSEREHDNDIRKETKNIIRNITGNDVMFWNTVLELIRNNKKDKYLLTPGVFVEQGYDIEDANAIMEAFDLHKIHTQVSVIIDPLDYVFARLIEEPSGDYIIPSDTLYRLAEAGYDFMDGLNDTAMQCIKYRNK